MVPATRPAPTARAHGLLWLIVNFLADVAVGCWGFYLGVFGSKDTSEMPRQALGTLSQTGESVHGRGLAAQYNFNCSPVSANIPCASYLLSSHSRSYLGDHIGTLAETCKASKEQDDVDSPQTNFTKNPFTYGTREVTVG